MLFSSEKQYHHMMTFYLLNVYQFLHILHHIDYYSENLQIILQLSLIVYLMNHILSFTDETLENISIVFTSLMFLNDSYSLISTL